MRKQVGGYMRKQVECYKRSDKLLLACVQPLTSLEIQWSSWSSEMVIKIKMTSLTMMTISTMLTISTMMSIMFVRKLEVVHKQVGGYLIPYNIQLACVRKLMVIWPNLKFQNMESSFFLSSAGNQDEDWRGKRKINIPSLSQSLSGRTDQAGPTHYKIVILTQTVGTTSTTTLGTVSAPNKQQKPL